MTTSRKSVCFTAPFVVDVVEEPMPRPQRGEVLVRSHVSAISAGTELLFYRGQVPKDMPVDSTISALSGTMGYPMRYGYASVGKVVETGSDVDCTWRGRMVFAFYPHTSHFVVNVRDILSVPAHLTAAQAALLPNMETAVNLLLDGAPVIGERVAVFGQGTVGLLTTALLAHYPLEQLVTFERLAARRAASRSMGASSSVDPESSAVDANDFDLAFELTGQPAALNEAIARTGFAGRIVIGSWYGSKRCNIELGGTFHRSRIRLLSSQVSTLQPEHSGRWSHQRRISTAWSMLEHTDVAALITHIVPIEQAAYAYDLLDNQAEGVIQILFTHERK